MNCSGWRIYGMELLSGCNYVLWDKKHAVNLHHKQSGINFKKEKIFLYFKTSLQVNKMILTAEQLQS